MQEQVTVFGCLAICLLSCLNHLQALRTYLMMSDVQNAEISTSNSLPARKQVGEVLRLELVSLGVKWV